MLHSSTLQLLRFHFSLFLLPVYLFALSEVPNVQWNKALLLGVILHGLVYPASNGYNSYMDRDESPIGGLLHPMQPTPQLFYTTLVMDLVSVGAAWWFFDWLVALGIFCYIIASRAYSWRGLRLKKYPLLGFAIVFFFQGAWVYGLTQYAVPAAMDNAVWDWKPLVTASLLIGALYPLTQVYQHEADLADGVQTISYKLGKRGTFVFSGILFGLAALLLFIWYQQQLRLNEFFLFLFITLPVVLFFCWWMRKVWQDASQANFTNSLRMNLVATGCTIIFFSTLIYIHHFE